VLPGLIEQGKFGDESEPFKHWESGLKNIPAALAHMKGGKHSAEKIVIKSE
jgi:hypothetical protein